MGVEEAAVGGGEVEGYGPHGREDGREPQQEQLHLLPHTITPSVSAHRVLIRLGTGLRETGLFAAAGCVQSIAFSKLPLGLVRLGSAPFSLTVSLSHCAGARVK